MFEPARKQFVFKTFVLFNFFIIYFKKSTYYSVYRIYYLVKPLI